MSIATKRKHRTGPVNPLDAVCAREARIPYPQASLDDLLDAKGLSVGDAAEQSGLTPQTLWYLRTGQNMRRPFQRTIGKLARLLGVSEQAVRAACQESLRRALPTEVLAPSRKSKESKKSKK